MALFGKNSQSVERDRMLNQEFVTIRYTSLLEAFHGESSTGSQDYKVITFTFPEDRKIVFLTMRGKVFLARDSARPVNLKNFLYWSDLSEEIKSSILVLTQDAPLNEHVLAIVADRVPKALSVLRGVINDFTTEAIIYVAKHFDDYVSIETDVAGKAPAAMKLLGNQGISFERIEKIVSNADFARENLEKMLGISGVSSEKVALSIVDQEKTDDTYEGRFVFGAAEADCTLEETWEQSSGFSWQSVLEKLQELVSKELVAVKVQENFEELPSDFEVKMSYEKFFRLTKNLQGDLKPLVEKVFVVSADLDLALRLTEDNRILEERVLEVEDNLIRSLVKEKYADFDDLPEEIQASVRVLILDRQEANDKREEILKRLQNLIVTDTHSAVDDQLYSSLDLKLAGVRDATYEVPAIDVAEEIDTNFSIPEEEIDFNFRDARIVDHDGESVVEEFEPGEDADENLESPMESFTSLAFEEKPRILRNSRFDLETDLDELNEHLKRMAVKTLELRKITTRGIPSLKEIEEITRTPKFVPRDNS